MPIYEWVALADAKNNLTDGANYFLAFQPIDAFVDMLKEFSIFKKWQQTNMVLVFIFENEKEVSQAESLLAGYKFKESILIKSISNMELKWIAATYAILFNNICFDKTSLIEMAIEYDIPLLFNNAENQNESLPSTWQQAGSSLVLKKKEDSLIISNYTIRMKCTDKEGQEWVRIGSRIYMQKRRIQL